MAEIWHRVEKSKQKIKIALTRGNTAFISLHMNAISLEYTDLSSAALIKIFQLADLLSVTPKEAAKIYISAKAKQSNGKKAA